MIVAPAGTTAPVPTFKSLMISFVGAGPIWTGTSGAPGGKLPLRATHGFPAAEPTGAVEVSGAVVVSRRSDHRCSSSSSHTPTPQRAARQQRLPTLHSCSDDRSRPLPNRRQRRGSVHTRLQTPRAPPTALSRTSRGAIVPALVSRDVRGQRGRPLKGRPRRFGFLVVVRERRWRTCRRRGRGVRCRCRLCRSLTAARH